MIQYVQSLPYYMHVVIGVIELGVACFLCPIVLAVIGVLDSLSVTARRVLMVVVASVMLITCVATGVLFAIAVMPSAWAGTGPVTWRQASTVPGFSIAAGVLWWYLVVDKKTSFVRSVKSRKRRRDA